MAVPKVVIDGRPVSISKHACERFAERTQLSLSEFCDIIDSRRYRKIGAPPTRTIVYKPRKHDRVQRDMEVEIATADAYVIYSIPDTSWFIFYVNNVSIMSTVMPLDWVRDRPVPSSIKEATLRDAVYGSMAPILPRVHEVQERVKRGLYYKGIEVSAWDRICSSLMQ